MSCWIGNENLKQELIETATNYKAAKDTRSNKSKYQFCNNMVNANRGFEVHPDFSECANYFIQLNQLYGEAFNRGINMHECRYIIIPIIRTKFNKNEADLLEKNIQRVRIIK